MLILAKARGGTGFVGGSGDGGVDGTGGSGFRISSISVLQWDGEALSQQGAQLSSPSDLSNEVQEM